MLIKFCEELSLQLKNMVTLEILTIKYWKDWNTDLANPLFLRMPIGQTQENRSSTKWQAWRS